MKNRGRQPNERVVIYALADANTPDVVRYVGQTANPMQRFRGHVAATGLRYTTIEPPVRRWLGTERPQVFMSCLEFCTAREAEERELHWMVEFRKAGMADLNVMSKAICTAFDVPHIPNHSSYRRPRQGGRRSAA
jgi:hypothetical protein